jgi:hypothetical protein
LVDVYFSTPAAMPHPVCVSLRPGERPLDKRGALMAINPEEMRHAMMSAIARDIEAGVDTAVLEQWRARVLSCTGTFVVHASDASRLHMAMQLRENLANDHETMSRTQLQRVYEVIYFRDVWAWTHGRDQASAVNIAGEYAKVKMAKGRETVSKSFVDTALTIHSRLLSIPAAETLLLDMDSALPRDCNPFNSVHRLQAIISKCGNSSTSSRDNTLWVLRHIRHMILDLNADPTTSDFSVDGLRGNNKTNNRGLVDVILLKKEALGYLCHKLPIQLGIEGGLHVAGRNPDQPQKPRHVPCIPERRRPDMAQPPVPSPEPLRRLRRGLALRLAARPSLESVAPGRQDLHVH